MERLCHQSPDLYYYTCCRLRLQIHSVIVRKILPFCLYWKTEVTTDKNTTFPNYINRKHHLICSKTKDERFYNHKNSTHNEKKWDTSVFVQSSSRKTEIIVRTLTTFILSHILCVYLYLCGGWVPTHLLCSSLQTFSRNIQLSFKLCPIYPLSNTNRAHNWSSSYVTSVLNIHKKNDPCFTFWTRPRRTCVGRIMCRWMF